MTARKKRKAKPREVFFVIGGGINRTKNPSQKAAEEYATSLLRGAADPNAQPMVNLVLSSRHIGKTWGMDPAAGAAVPAIERKQCSGKGPLLIVKLVSVVEIAPTPVVARKPRAEELA